MLLNCKEALLTADRFGTWNTDGCREVTRSDGILECECTQLGHFGILLVRCRYYLHDVSRVYYIHYNHNYVVSKIFLQHAGLESNLSTRTPVHHFECCHICRSGTVNNMSGCLYSHLPAQQVS